MAACSRFLFDDEGTTAVEYAVMLALIIASIIGAIATVGQGNGGLWANNSQQIGDAMSGS